MIHKYPVDEDEDEDVVARDDGWIYYIIGCRSNQGPTIQNPFDGPIFFVLPFQLSV